MIDSIYIKKIDYSECKFDLLKHFDRYQEAHRNWRKQGTQWVLCDDPFTESWDDEKKKQVANNLARCIERGGYVLGVFRTIPVQKLPCYLRRRSLCSVCLRCSKSIVLPKQKKYSLNKMIGFASIHGELFGSENQYVNLEYMHISNGFRGKGMGKELFKTICEVARQRGVKKLYISANSAEDSIAFYRKVGCVDACEINNVIQQHEPFDCQLEYNLTDINCYTTNRFHLLETHEPRINKSKKAICGSGKFKRSLV